MRCANILCRNVFISKKTDHIYCSPKCGFEARRIAGQDSDRSRFHDAPAYPVTVREQQKLVEQITAEELTAQTIKCETFIPAGAVSVRFGCPRNDRDLEGDFVLRWFPARSICNLEHLKFPGPALPKAAHYVIAYLNSDGKLLVPWKYKIYIDWFQPNLPWYLGDRCIGFRKR